MNKYKDFQIKELFDIHPTKAYKLTNAFLFDKDGTVPVVTNTSENHGRLGYSKLEPTEHDIITFSDTGTKSPESFFYQEGEFIGYPHVQGMYPYSDKWDKLSLIYLTVLLRKKTRGLYDYSTKMNRDIILNMYIKLPVNSSGEIDFEMMKNQIATIEKNGENIWIEAMCEEGLNDYILTEDEKKAVSYFKQKKALKQIKADQLFCVKANPQLNKDSFVFSNKGEYPYFTRTIFNNGILGYVNYLDEEHKIKGNSIAVGMMGMKFFYMKTDFYAGQFTKTIFPICEEFDENIALYFITFFNRNSRIYLSGLVRDFEKLFYDTDIYVPMKDGVIDYEMIRLFISAQKKDIAKILLN